LESKLAVVFVAQATDVAVDRFTENHRLVERQVVVDFNVVQAVIQVVFSSCIREEIIIFVLKKLLMGQLAPSFCQSARIRQSLNERAEQLVDPQSNLPGSPRLFENMDPGVS